MSLEGLDLAFLLPFPLSCCLRQMHCWTQKSLMSIWETQQLVSSLSLGAALWVCWKWFVMARQYEEKHTPSLPLFTLLLLWPQLKKWNQYFKNTSGYYYFWSQWLIHSIQGSMWGRRKRRGQRSKGKRKLRLGVQSHLEQTRASQTPQQSSALSSRTGELPKPLNQK